MSGYVPYASDDEATLPARLNTPRRGAGRSASPQQRGATPNSRSRAGTPPRSRSPYRPSGQESTYAPGSVGYQPGEHSWCCTAELLWGVDDAQCLAWGPTSLWHVIALQSLPQLTLQAA